MGSVINIERKVVYTDINEKLNPFDYEHLDVWIKADLVLNANSDIYYRTEDARWRKILSD